ncbi:type II toxin-antitoxin system RelE/ParE family toxin [Leucothrix mucor]|uniref:type II toxin-antitoxin system RelE/ParE family toxin n=1 Tax=Leucothrix mucor TaxID=45248 RepID=UPI0003B456CF|nr:type II toxin-antitoxin system RelE/ParE family toxin [Leucothrix mucor]
MTVRFTEDAKSDIKAIYIYSYQNFGRQQADKYFDALSEKMETLSDVVICSDYSFVREGLKRLNHQSHAIYYREDEDDVLVLIVLHQRMDPALHMRDEPT